MRDDRFDELMDDAVRTYRVPPAPPLDAMWTHIEHEHFGARPRWWRTASGAWRIAGLGIAAALVLGVGIGRFSARLERDAALATIGSVAGADPREDGLVATSTDVAYQQTTTRYLGETAALLIALPSEVGEGRADRQFVAQAGELLTTTRLLLDSPASSQPELKSLLEDLELVLAQIARLPAKRGAAELDLITRALEQHDVVPRLRSVVAEMPITD
jgi:hypothetical protein